MPTLPTVPLLDPSEERSILEAVRAAALLCASPTFSAWNPKTYFKATQAGITPLAGHSRLLAATVWNLLGGWVCQGTILYPGTRIRVPHTWNLTANKTSVDLASDQFPGGNGFDPLEGHSVSYIILPPHAFPHHFPATAAERERWECWVEALSHRREFTNIFADYRLRLPATWR